MQPENVAEIDVARAEAAKHRAEEMLKEGPPGYGFLPGNGSRLAALELAPGGCQRYRQRAAAVTVARRQVNQGKAPE